MTREADCIPTADAVVSVSVAKLDDGVVYLEVDGEHYRLSDGNTPHIGVKLEVLH